MRFLVHPVPNETSRADYTSLGNNDGNRPRGQLPPTIRAYAFLVMDDTPAHGPSYGSAGLLGRYYLYGD